MPRKVRQLSSTGVYHVMIRGINGLNIFTDEIDKQQFLIIMKRIKKDNPYELFAYCLMSNHVHLLIREGEEGISQLMRRIGTSYVYYFNNRHDRYGHLYQDRFRSEVVEDEKYLLRAMRYILQNPLKAGMVASISDYPWSSWAEYLQTDSDFDITDTEFILSLFGNDPLHRLQAFQDCMLETDEENSEFDEQQDYLDNEELKNIILQLLGGQSIERLHEMGKKERDRILRKVKALHVTNKQIEEVTGLGKNIIQRA